MTVANVMVPKSTAQKSKKKVRGKFVRTRNPTRLRLETSIALITIDTQNDRWPASNQKIGKNKFNH